MLTSVPGSWETWQIYRLNSYSREINLEKLWKFHMQLHQLGLLTWKNITILLLSTQKLYGLTIESVYMLSKYSGFLYILRYCVWKGFLSLTSSDLRWLLTCTKREDGSSTQYNAQISHFTHLKKPCFKSS